MLLKLFLFLGIMVTEVNWKQWKDQGSKFFRKQKWTKVMNCYTSVIGLKPDEANLYSNRALCAIKLKQIREDEEFSLCINPHNIKFYQRKLTHRSLPKKYLTRAAVATSPVVRG